MDRERRLTPRSAVAKHAYIDIQPNNGAIVLNVSDGGLCFHSFDPVRLGNTRFMFCDRKQRIEAEGEIVWTDETHKGGMRFNPLPADARDLLARWTSEVPAPVAPEKPMPVAAVPATVRVRVPLSGFTGGLVVGLLFSLFVTIGFLFHMYRAQIGQSLIRIGEEFVAQKPTSGPTMPPSAVVTLPAAAMPTPSAKALVGPAEPPVSTKPAPSEKATPVVAQPAPARAANTPSAEPEKVELPAPPPAVSNTAVAAAHQTAPPRNVSLASAVVPPPITVPVGTEAARAPSTFSVVPKVEPSPELHTEESRTQSPEYAPEMFFEVGRFKNKRQAKSEIEKLTELGFPANSVQKNHLWANAYHVVVGPYDDNQEASATHKELVSRGFTPRPFERGSRYLTLQSEMSLNGKAIPIGECTVNWESYATDATVKIVHDNSVVATAEGRWVKSDVKYDTDAYLYRRDHDGSRMLLEIRFAGMRQALDLSPTPSRSKK